MVKQGKGAVGLLFPVYAHGHPKEDASKSGGCPASRGKIFPYSIVQIFLVSQIPFNDNFRFPFITGECRIHKGAFQLGRKQADRRNNQ